MTLAHLSAPKVKPDQGDLKRVSPFSEMSRRDEGDGRSIADSSCSSYKGTQFRGYPNAGTSSTDKTLTRLGKNTLVPHVPVPMVRRTKPN